MKICSKCKIEKQLTEFSKKSCNKDGLRANCKSCDGKYRKERSKQISEYQRKYKAANAEALKEQKREYSLKNAHKRIEYRSANAEKIIAYRKSYYAKNRLSINERCRAYSAANREKRNAQNRAYHYANPEKSAEHRRNRRAKRRNAEGKHTASDIRAIFSAQRGLCANCQVRLFKSGPNKMHVDHIIPLALGGSNWPSNLQCLCQVCNLRKSSKDPIAWANENGKLL